MSESMGSENVGTGIAGGASPPCIVVVELLTDYVEGALDPDAAARVEAHLARCPPCLTYLEQLRETTAALRGLPTPPLSDQLTEELEAAFADFHR